MNSTTPLSNLNMPGGDIVLISSDQVRFTVHKGILSNASPVFEGMLSLPSTGADHEDTELPVVAVTETSTVLHQLVSFCYPSLNGTVSDVDMLRLLIAAADKYEMKGVTSQLAQIIRWQFVETEPYASYAIACRYGFWDVATLAGKQTLAHLAPGPSLPEYDVLPAAMYHKLVIYRKKCVDLISPLLDDWRFAVWGTNDNVYWTGQSSDCAVRRFKQLDRNVSADWFQYHLSTTKTAYLERPRSATVLSATLTQEIAQFRCLSTKPSCSCHPARSVEFNQRLAAVLDQQIAEIPFDFE
ncbi:hypothetical protein BC835DRAFT_1310884 [Cytidiella melzeri]|nr:hypothetical protein BC835DRAFT_1310884 [Cytidiella melzeri]